MTIAARKITVFAKTVGELADQPKLATTALLKAQFDSSPEELRVALNGLIDDLSSVLAGFSGAENISSAPIAGLAGGVASTVYAQLADLKSQLTNVVLGLIPDGTISTAKLTDGSVTFDKQETLGQLGYIGGLTTIYKNGGFL